MNLLRCVKTYGDGFQSVPLSEVDSLVFSALAYLDWKSVAFGEGFSLPLSALAGRGEALARGSIHPKKLSLLLEEAARSARYSVVQVGYFREIISTRLPMRFAAVSFRLPGGEVYSAFRGTDATIAAWHEDFDLLFLRAIPSQIEAARYLSFVMERERGPFYAGGHSKGGNLAVYAAANGTKAEQSRLISVFDHDGPGFCERFFKEEGYLGICARVQKSVPHDTLIGVLFTHTLCYEIVKSRKRLLGQHNPFMWDILSLTAFYTLPARAKISVRAEEAILKFISGMDDSDRIKFVSGLFSLLEASGVETVFDLKKGRLGLYRRMYRAYRSLPERERLLVKRGGALFFKIAFRVVRADRSVKAPCALSP